MDRTVGYYILQGTQLLLTMTTMMIESPGFEEDLIHGFCQASEVISVL
jgi:hypothetical protein